MKFAASIATMALTASTLTSPARAEDIYVTLYPPSELQRISIENLILIAPQKGPSESDVRPDMRPIIGVDLTFREQQYFAQYISGRDWADRTPLPSNQRNDTYTFRFNVESMPPQESSVYDTPVPSNVPAPSMLAISGLGLLVAARRMRR
jgi:hypothetical protein